jgi:hypothetical protein
MSLLHAARLRPAPAPATRDASLIRPTKISCPPTGTEQPNRWPERSDEQASSSSRTAIYNVPWIFAAGAAQGYLLLSALAVPPRPYLVVARRLQKQRDLHPSTASQANEAVPCARSPPHSRGPHAHSVRSLQDSVDQACPHVRSSTASGRPASGRAPALARRRRRHRRAHRNKLWTDPRRTAKSRSASRHRLPALCLRVSVHVRLMYGANQTRWCGGSAAHAVIVT